MVTIAADPNYYDLDPDQFDTDPDPTFYFETLWIPILAYEVRKFS